MKVLFVSSRISWKGTGAFKVSQRNLKCIQDILGEKNVNVVDLNKYTSNLRINFMNRYIYKFSNKYLECLKKYIVYDILKTINLIDFDFIFIDSSAYGVLCKEIKKVKPDIKIAVFFHDVNKQLIKSLIDIEESLYRKFTLLYRYFGYVKNENLSISNSNTIITLNSRDSDLLKLYYKLNDANKIKQLPITMEDDFDANKVIMKNNTQEKKQNILFVGAYYKPNIEGIMWFINNVFSRLENAILTIVGKDMDKLFIENKNIILYGYCDDISLYYYNADVVISPIFNGGGMKVKVAEALMYGKTILGTSESFEGYELDFEKIGRICDTADDFVKELNNSQFEKFNIYSRNEFISKYSNNRALKELRDIIFS